MKYDNLDRLIIDSLKSGPKLLHQLPFAVDDEAFRLEKETGRFASRIIDGRLQALRKGGFIEYDHKSGWRLK